MPIDPVVDVQQIVLLDLGDHRCYLGDACHACIIGGFVFVGLGCEDFQGQRDGEAVRSASLGEVDDPLPARAESSKEAVVFGPAKTLIVE